VSRGIDLDGVLLQQQQQAPKARNIATLTGSLDVNQVANALPRVTLSRRIAVVNEILLLASKKN